MVASLRHTDARRMLVVAEGGRAEGLLPIGATYYRPP